FELSKAEDVTGIARGIAFQLVEALGVIERNKIAAEMKDLDQPARAILRKYGVRFGAYHIYFPTLLKPAARALASLLWGLKHDHLDLQALSGAQHLASSGRTSFPVDKGLPCDAYRVLGYRQCGERAVRVDILERLADLVRPALAWRETSPGAKPPGAFDGRSFVVTQAMTSLTGSAGEDFASILRALGYRMEKRPPLPVKPVVAETPAADAAPAEAVAQAPAEPATDTPSEAAAGATVEAAADVADKPVSGDPAPSGALLPEVAPLASSEQTPVVVEAQGEPVAESEPVAEASPEPAPTLAAAEPALEAAAGVAAASAEASPAEAASSDGAPAAPAEPQLVEVWRPGGRSEERRPRHERHRHHRHGQDKREGKQQGRQQGGQQAKPEDGAAATEGQAAEGEKREHHRRRHRDRKPREGTAPDVNAAAAAEGAPAREARPEQRDRGDRRERFEAKGRDRDAKREKFGERQGERRDDRDRRDRDRGRDKRDRESGPALRHYASSSNPRERGGAADPNSPFAKLAALKEQLAGNRKE